MNITDWIAHADLLYNQLFLIVMGGLYGLAYLTGYAYETVNIYCYFVFYPATFALFFTSKKKYLVLFGTLLFFIIPDVNGKSVVFFDACVDFINYNVRLFHSDYVTVCIYWCITLPMDLATSSSTSPSLYAYYAAQYIIGANGLFSKLKISDLLQEGLRSKKSALERHHLFPKAWLERNGVSDQTQRNQIANYALVEWNDNINISDTQPSQYLPNYLIRLSAEDKDKMYYWHALSENWEQMDYFDFLIDRRKRIAQVVKDAYETISK